MNPVYFPQPISLIFILWFKSGLYILEFLWIQTTAIDINSANGCKCPLFDSDQLLFKSIKNFAIVPIQIKNKILKSRGSLVNIVNILRAGRLRFDSR